jgi:hypothetical protein
VRDQVVLGQRVEAAFHRFGCSMVRQRRLATRGQAAELAEGDAVSVASVRDASRSWRRR